MSRGYLAAKRALDLVGSLGLLAVLSPVLAVSAVLVRATSQGPVLFKQARVGQHGRTFEVLKFRTMIQDADEGPHREFIGDLMSEAAAANASAPHQVFKIVGDPRVTRVGRVLRKSSIDELPQLVNVVRGDMSLVGPRPDVPYSVERYEPQHRRRLLVKPGMTGLWQVSGRGNVSLRQMLELDVEYVDRASLGLDLRILWQTVPAVLRKDGAH
jgi:lipopolysaccharide/colanic/teichoic acid biosynthesis glycosyltransferase